jgi:hypothetical protein
VSACKYIEETRSPRYGFDFVHFIHPAAVASSNCLSADNPLGYFGVFVIRGTADVIRKADALGNLYNK